MKKSVKNMLCYRTYKKIAKTFVYIKNLLYICNVIQ